MKVINYWEKFLSTGSINDYLNYRGEEAKGCTVGAGYKKPAGSGTFTGVDKTAELGEDKGAGKVEGTGQCYRDNIKNGTHRGV